MDIVKKVDHNKISQIIHSIQKAPDSWKDWCCVYIDAPIFFGGDEYKEIESDVDAIINDQLGIVSGNAYISEDNNILILCKDVDELQLQEVAISLMYEYKKISLSKARYKYFDLPSAINDLIHYHMNIKLKALEKGKVVSDGLDNSAKVKSILVVDDDPMTCRMVFNSFHDKHYIIVAHDGEEALREFDKYKPDLVLLDINMPKMNGFEVLNSIMEMNPQAKILMFSGDENVENISTCINDGAVGFVGKPFNREVVQKYINNL